MLLISEDFTDCASSNVGEDKVGVLVVRQGNQTEEASIRVPTIKSTWLKQESQ